MGTLRNLTAADLSVTALDGRIVEPDQLVDVPDEVLEQYVWPAETWAVEYTVDDARTVTELRDELKAAGLPTSGTKKELLDRLAEPAAPTAQPATVSDEG